MRRQSTYHYHTFPSQPPLPKTPSDTNDRDNNERDGDGDQGHGARTRRGLEEQLHTTPLPWRQLGLLALLSLAEQTALNSISPYVPAMVASFPEIPDGEEGVYVGLLASAFALAQLATNFLWGYWSDRIGRKPVMLLGTSLLMVCFVFFGFCTSFAQLIVVHMAMGLLNGNAAVVPTCLGEVTDRSNQSRAFIWLPIMYSIGGITGPAVGGLLVGTVDGIQYPFLAPNLLSAVLLLSAVVVLAVWFDETLEGVGGDQAYLGEWWQRLRKAVAHCGLSSKAKPVRPRSWSSRWPTRASVSTAEEDSEGSDDNVVRGSRAERRGLLGGTTDGAAAESADDAKHDAPAQPTVFRELANRTTLTVLGTYLVFQLSNISFNSLFPIFASAPEPTGRELGPSTIGLSLSVAGLATILFQIFAFQPLKTRMGNLGTYRLAILGIAASTTLMPWIGHLHDAPLFGLGSGQLWLYLELGVILVIKNTSAVGGLSSVMLLITNSAPSHETLGTLNGIAQSLSAAGRSVGPLLAGGLFTLSSRLPGNGDVLAWGLFVGIALVGWLGTLSIRRDGLESEDWIGGHDEGLENGEETDAEAALDAR